MNRLLDNFIKALLLIRYNAIPKRLLKRDFSKSALKLMQRAGFFPDETEKLVTIQCLEFNKRVFKLSQFSKLIRFVCPQWDDLSIQGKINIIRSRFYRFDVFVGKESLELWNYFIYRDKESVKWTLFNLAAKEKKVFWSSFRNFKNEIDYSNLLAENGISVVPFTQINASMQYVVQPILDLHKTSPKAIKMALGDLSGYYKRTAEIEDYQAHVDYFRGELKQLDDDLLSYFDSISDKVLSTVPTTRVHGDLSPSNILWNEMNYYLIDYDRTFRASIYYDLVHLYLLQITEIEEEIFNIFADYQTVFNANAFKNQAEKLKFAISLFIIDNYRYLEMAPSEKKFSFYTQKLIHDGLKAWKRIN